MKNLRPFLSLSLAFVWAGISAEAQITAPGPDPASPAPAQASPAQPASVPALPNLKLPVSASPANAPSAPASSTAPKGPPPPSEPAAAFAAGVAAYEKGDFSTARDDFLSAARTATSPALEINLGDSYYETAEFGPAILHYLRALALDPRNPAARANLDLARQVANVTAPAPTRLERLATSLSVTQWTWLATVFGWVALFLFFLPRLYRWQGATPWLLLAASVVIAGTAITALAGWHLHAKDGVVLQADSPLKFSPTAHSQSVGLAQAGDVATLVERNGEYYLVVSADGHRGWIAAGSYQPVWQ